MTAIEEYRRERLKKIDKLREYKMDPYPAHTDRNISIQKFIDTFDKLSQKETKKTLAGRVMSIREHGKSAFVDIYDGSARIQVFLRADVLPKGTFDLFLETVDEGDFIECRGHAFVTKVGEKSVLAQKWKMLAKSIRPVPDEWYGLKDEDERYRKRYLDMLLDEGTADLVRKRSIFWNAVRSFMLKRDFVEVHTPILETKTGGAEARPFITHHRALDMDVYLRISTELWHKKLIIGGIPKVFEIGRVFRNEGMSHEHAQDYMHFEFYEAYQDAHKGMATVIQLYRAVAEQTFGTLIFKIGEFDVDLGKEWEEYDFNALIEERYGFDPRTVDRKTIEECLTKEGISLEEGSDVGRGVDLLWKKVRKTIGGPAILTGIPVYLEPLAKKSADDPRVVDRFQILIGGSEVGKAFNELNDPLDQRERFEHQQALRDKGDEEAQMADFDYVEAMEYGMPPTFGFGVSERLFSFLAGKSIREAQLFPLMRPRQEGQ
jgi:lysyl-tRNA synthetase class 2